MDPVVLDGQDLELRAVASAAREAVRRVVPFMETDRVLADDIAPVDALLASGALRAAAETTSGRLR